MVTGLMSCGGNAGAEKENLAQLPRGRPELADLVRTQVVDQTDENDGSDQCLTDNRWDEDRAETECYEHRPDERRNFPSNATGKPDANRDEPGEYEQKCDDRHYTRVE